VREHNATSRKLLEAEPGFAETRQSLQAILDSKERIPAVVRRGDWLYNFWRDEKNPRGLWRRTSLESFRQAEPQWDVILDLDALAAAEKENWVWGGAQLLGGRSTRCLLSLARRRRRQGGAGVRPGHPALRGDGFTLPEAKSELDWLDEDHVFVGTDFGPGALTDSGYPRVVKLWKRGTPLSAATLVYEGQKTDVAAFASVDPTPGFERVVVGVRPTSSPTRWPCGRTASCCPSTSRWTPS
jgi:prolyl oligopeptidase